MRGWGGEGVRCGALALLLLASPAAAAKLPVSRVTGLRHFSSPGYTRVVVDLSASTRHRVSVVAASAGAPPRRIYIDFPEALPGTKVPKRQAIGGGLLGGVRLGLSEAGGARVVLEVRSIRDYRVFRLAAPPRLVIDVRGVVARAVAAAGTRRPVPDARREGRSHVPERRRDGRRPLPRARRRPRIVIDPGHGGRDPGARSPSGLEETVVTLAVARRLGERLQARLGAAVTLTRTGDEFVPLEARTARANAEGADLFVSIHANASPGGHLHGIETYYLDNTDDRATIRLAAMENGLGQLGVSAGGARGSEVRYILSDLVQAGKMEDSMALARVVQRGLVASIRARYSKVSDLGVKRGPFYVLVGAYMPCVLVEVSFIDNPLEGRRLAQEAYREAVAEGIYRGIARFLAESRLAHNL